MAEAVLAIPNFGSEDSGSKIRQYTLDTTFPARTIAPNGTNNVTVSPSVSAVYTENLPRFVRFRVDSLSLTTNLKNAPLSDSFRDGIWNKFSGAPWHNLFNYANYLIIGGYFYVLQVYIADSSGQVGLQQLFMRNGGHAYTENLAAEHAILKFSIEAV